MTDETVLPSDSTIGDLVERSTLTQSESYVRGVLENMHACRREHGSALVRIGITGEGRRPHYWVSPELPDRDVNAALDIEDLDFELLLDPTRSQEWANKHSRSFLIFDGRNHGRREEWGILEVRREHWSTRQSTLEQLAELLGELRQRR